MRIGIDLGGTTVKAALCTEGRHAAVQGQPSDPDRQRSRPESRYENAGAPRCAGRTAVQ